MDFHRFSLSNGMKGIAVPTVADDPVSLQAWFAYGSRAEKDHEAGISHLIEHLFFQGGKDFPDSKSVQRELWLLGEKSNAMTGVEFVMYYITTDVSQLERAAHLLSDMLVHARMSEKDLEKEKAVVVQELKAADDDPVDYAQRAYARFIFGSHPLGRDTIGTKESITGFSADDIHNYRNRYCGPPNGVLSVAGGFNSQDVGRIIGVLEKYFAQLSVRQAVEWTPFTAPPVLPPAESIVRPDLQQAHIFIGGFAPSFMSPDEGALRLLINILSRRLWLSIREDQGLAYTVAAVPKMFSDCGTFMVYAGVDNDEYRIMAAAESVLREMARLRSGEVTEAEIEETKTMLHTSTALSLESVWTKGVFFGSEELQRGRACSLREFRKRIDRVAKEDILRLAHQIWQEESVRSLILAGDFPGYEEKYRELRSVLKT